MTGSRSTSAAVPASDDDARAEFKGDGFTTLRQNNHQYLDCTTHGGGKLSCKRL